MLKSTNRYIPIIILGISSISTQVVFLRTLLSVFYGNEMIIGIMLANWMFLTGFGAWLARITPERWRKVYVQGLAFLALGLLPFLCISLVTMGRIWWFPPGGVAGFNGIFWFTLLVPLPYCLVSGWLFPTLSATITSQPEYAMSDTFGAESLGSFGGALVFNTILVFYLSSFSILYILFLMCLAMGTWLLWENHPKKAMYTAGFLLVTISLFIIWLRPQELLSRYYFHPQILVEERESPYGKLSITEASGQQTFYENGLPIFAAQDVATREEAVHYAMMQRPWARKVLLISGGISGQLEEILKYPVRQVDYMEANPLIFEAGRQYQLIPQDDRVRLIQADARMFLGTSSEQYDVVLIQTPDPVSAQCNRYYTLEFFRGLVKNMSPKAVVSISLRSSGDYMNPLTQEIHALVYQSLFHCFRKVVFIPGGRNYFLASDAPLRVDIATLADSIGITTAYVNPQHIDIKGTTQRSERFMAGIKNKAGLNRDFHPRVYLHETRLWLLAFTPSWWVPIVFPGVLLFWFLLRIRRNEVSVFVTGFSTSSLLFLLLITFQSLYGYVYLVSGLAISIFMLGIAGGGRLYTFLDRRDWEPHPAWIQIFLGAGVLLLMMFLLGYQKLTESNLLIQSIFGLFGFLCGVFTGLQYAASGRMGKGSFTKAVSGLYGSDLAGSALGMILTATLFFPWGGLVWVCLGLGLVNFIVGVIQFGYSSES